MQMNQIGPLKAFYDNYCVSIENSRGFQFDLLGKILEELQVIITHSSSEMMNNDVFHYTIKISQLCGNNWARLDYLSKSFCKNLSNYLHSQINQFGEMLCDATRVETMNNIMSGKGFVGRLSGSLFDDSC